MICILVSLPVTPILWRAAAKTLGLAFDALGYAVLTLTTAVFAIYINRHRERFSAFSLLLLALFATVYFYLLKYQCRFPAERLHLMEYGLLAYLFYRALRFDFSKASAYVLGFLLSSGFGFMDEVIQYFLPNRVFELRDVMTNVAASALGLLVVGVLLKANSFGDSRREGET